MEPSRPGAANACRVVVSTPTAPAPRRWPSVSRSNLSLEEASGDGAVDRQRVKAVAGVIEPYVRVTPTLEVNGGDFGLAPFPLTLKLELLQHSGSFKARGAFANLLLRPSPRPVSSPRPAATTAPRWPTPRCGWACARRSSSRRCRRPRRCERIRALRRRSRHRRRPLRGRARGQRGVGRPDGRAAGARLRSGRDAPRPGHARHGARGAGAGARRRVLVPVGGGGLIGGVAGWYAGGVEVVGVEPELAPTLYRGAERRPAGRRPGRRHRRRLARAPPRRRADVPDRPGATSPASCS